MKKILITFLLLITTAPAWAYVDITGYINDAYGPLIGAGISEQGTNQKAATTNDGKFVIAVKSNDSILEISSIGYETKTIKAADIKESEPIVLQEKNETLDDAVISGAIGSKCTEQELQSQDPNAVSGKVKDYNYTNKKATCDIKECVAGFKPSLDGMSCKSTKCSCHKEWDDGVRDCVPWKTTTCTATGAVEAERDCDASGREYCKIKKCDTATYLEEPNENNICVSNNGSECESDDPHAAVATYDENHNCVVRACKNTDTEKYKLKNGKCVVSQNVATPEQVAELKNRADAARANETSLANRTITAGAIASVGTGGMMIGSALSEQAADENIESEMRAYLETFRCEYGSNKSARGGDVNVELPGGNDMFNLYAQYAALAEDLKMRKTALGLKPGIESEIVIDKAETGLYDDVGTGITGGNYISVARALADPNGADAKRWAEQKAKTAEKLETGIKTAAIGAAASLAANIAVNDIFKKKAKTIPAMEKLEQINQIEPQEPNPSCPAITIGGTWPKCKCLQQDQKFSDKDGGKCEPCTGGQVQSDDDPQACVCPPDKPRIINGECSAAQDCSNACKGPHQVVLDEKCNCGCEQGFNPDDKNSCVQDTVLVTTENQVSQTVNMNTKSLFKINSFDLTDDAKKTFDEFIAKWNTDKANYKNCEFRFDGYTDPTGNDKSNQRLSEQRANAVKQYFTSKGISDKMASEGHGKENCVCQAENLTSGCKGKSAGAILSGSEVYTPCRRVEVTLTCTEVKTEEVPNSAQQTTPPAAPERPATIQTSEPATVPVNSSATAAKDYGYNLYDLKTNPKQYVRSKTNVEISDTDSELVVKFINTLQDKWPDVKLARIEKIGDALFINTESDNTGNDFDTYCNQLNKQLNNEHSNITWHTNTTEQLNGCVLQIRLSR